MSGTSDPNIPQHLKTGFGNVDGAGHEYTRLQRRLITLATTLVSRAVSSSSQHARHNGRTEAEVMDVLMALRYECKRFFEGDLQELEKEADETDSKLDTVLKDMGYDTFDSFVSSIQEEQQESEDEDEDDSEGVSSRGEDEEFGSESSCLESSDGLEGSESESDAMHPGSLLLCNVADISTCTCELCAAVRHAHETWDAWIPKDEVEQFLKDKTNEVFQSLAPESA